MVEGVMMKNLTSKQVQSFITQMTHHVEQKQNTLTGAHALRFVIEQLVKDQTHNSIDLVAPEVSYSLLLSALVIALVELSMKQ